MTAHEAPDRVAKLLEVASRLQLEAATGEACERLGDRGAGVRLLKGASIARWLYSAREPRGSLDCDLLIAPRDFIAAEETLVSLGYGRHWDDSSMPAWWREHASLWIRDRDGVTIDLHRTLPGVGVDDEAAWAVLARDPEVMIVGGRDALALSFPARALHVALHAAHHGVEWRRPLDDLQRALGAGDEQLWRSATELAVELNALDAFTAGLRLTDAGAALADRLGLGQARSVKAALSASSPPPIALGFEQLASAATTRERIAIAWHKLVPPREFIRHWDPRASNSRWALARAYLRRPLWLLQNAPRGFRAWQEARRAVRSEDHVNR